MISSLYSSNLKLSIPAFKKQHSVLFLEIFFYLAIFSISVGMRLWGLDDRAVHHDESLHNFFSYQHSNGNFYKHHPITHGMFLFHTTAATFFIFGDSDLTGRLPMAIFGSVLVLIPLLLRPWIGRFGAVSAALMLSFSPSLLYYSRFARNDIFMAVFALTMTASVWQYMRTRKNYWLYIIAAVLALGFTTKETQYIIIASLGVFLFFVILPDIWKRFTKHAKGESMSPAVDIFIVIFSLSLPFFAAGFSIFQNIFGVIIAAPDGTLNAITGTPVGNVALGIAIAITAVLFLIGAAIGLFWNVKRWLIAFIIFWFITLFMFTNFFTYPVGALSGTWQSLGYWLAQQDVARGGQPWYYFLMLTGVYEFLPLIFASLATFYYASREIIRTIMLPYNLRSKVKYLLNGGDLFAKYSIFWILSTFIAYSVAGEKFPWLLVNIVPPMIILSAKAINSLALLFLRSITTNRGALIPYTFSIIGLLIFVILQIVTIRSASLASYRYVDYPQELLIYTQTSHQTHNLARSIDNIADSAPEGYALPISVGSELNWPWRWYLRRYTNVTYNKTFSIDENQREEKTESANYTFYLVNGHEKYAFENSVTTVNYTDGEATVLRWSFPESKYRCGSGPVPASDEPSGWWCPGGTLVVTDIYSALLDSSRWREPSAYWWNREIDGSNFSEDLYIPFSFHVYVHKDYSAFKQDFQ